MTDDDRRSGTTDGARRSTTTDGDGRPTGERSDERGRDRPDPTRVVADADVLVADLLVGGDARAALDLVREHSWLSLVASDALLDDAAAAIATLAGDESAGDDDPTEADDPDGNEPASDLAADWRERIDRERVRVEHPEGDHPGLASALHGDAAHVLSFDGDLTSASAGVGLQGRVAVSVRTPAAFASVFDPPALYEAEVGGDYPGPDVAPRD